MKYIHQNQISWLDSVKKCRSSHYDQRPSDIDISLLVIHNISLPPGQFGGDYIDDLFLGQLDPAADPYFEQLKSLRVSAHCMINRQGQVTQYVSLLDRAWHAGRSLFEGHDDCNNFSIGIELEGTDELAYTDAQYLALSALTNTLQQQFSSITKERIVCHCDIAPGRKTDPGRAFDWSRYFAMLG